jgi:hypothetical protein
MRTIYLIVCVMVTGCASQPLMNSEIRMITDGYYKGCVEHLTDVRKCAEDTQDLTDKLVEYRRTATENEKTTHPIN